MAVDIFGPELFVPRIADIVGFQHHLPWKFSLHAPIVVVHVGIADALRKDDSGQDCDVWAEWRPPSEISGGLRTDALRSEEHTSELQSLAYLVCRLLLEKKKNKLTIRSEEQTSELQSLAYVLDRLLRGKNIPTSRLKKQYTLWKEQKTYNSILSPNKSL